MSFNSLEFAIFLPIVFIVYWAVPQRARWVVLLISSYYFYMSWNAAYVVLILFTTAVSYTAGWLIHRFSDNLRRKRRILAACIATCFAVLFVFKYFNFAVGSICGLVTFFGYPVHEVSLKLLLPVGISFYTFQTASYVIDVYRGTVPAEKHFGYYALFISFFPQLVAGPIERPGNLLPQLRQKNRRFDYNKAVDGLKLMTWGFYKKMAVADRIGPYVDVVFDNVHAHNGGALLIASLLFTIQIYCVFSGYSDIAIGTAKLLGIDLMTNFRTPYFSGSIREFWGRWHISLSQWLRDYIYIPLGGNRKGRARQSINIMITFLASGLWHGAGWNFVLWGGMHGVGQVAENVIFPKGKCEKGIAKVLRTIGTFIFCSLAWIFFRCANISDAWYAVTHLWAGVGRGYISAGLSQMGLGRMSLGICMLAIMILVAVDYIISKKNVIETLKARPVVLRWTLYLALVLAVIFLSPVGGNGQFIYFQF